MVFRLIHTALLKASGILFPERCFGCGKADELFCEACERFFASPERTRLSSGVIVLSLFHYSTPAVRKAIRHIKYRRAKRLAERFGGISAHYARDLSSLFPETHSPLLVPVPISQKTKRIRGYNHAEVFMEHVAKACNWETDMHAILKTTHTPSQTTLRTKMERKKNIRGSLTLAKNFSPKERAIILVDDVLTSGATLNECARILRDAGAEKIFGITIAKG